MMNSVFVFLVIFLCANQELVGGTPVPNILKRTYSNTIGRLFAKSKSSIVQGNEADYSYGYGNYDYSNPSQPVSYADREGEIVQEDVIPFRTFMDGIKEKIAMANMNGEQQIDPAQIEELVKSIHNAPGENEELTFDGVKSNVRVGAKGSIQRLKNEAETTSFWKMILNGIKGFFKWLWNLYKPKEKKPGVNTSKQVMEAGKGAIPGRPSMEKGSAANSKKANGNDLPKLSQSDSFNTEKSPLSDYGSPASPYGARENAKIPSPYPSPLVAPLKAEETPHAKAAAAAKEKQQNGDGLGSTAHNPDATNGDAVNETEEERAKRTQNEKEKASLGDKGVEKILEKRPSEQKDGADLIRMASNIHSEPAAGVYSGMDTAGTDEAQDHRTMNEYYKGMADFRGAQDQSKVKEQPTNGVEDKSSTVPQNGVENKSSTVPQNGVVKKPTKASASFVSELVDAAAALDNNGIKEATSPHATP